jgi:hypothetical protein
MSASNGGATKPLLLLDIDGVINDLDAVMRIRPLGPGAEVRAATLGVDLVRSNGFWVAIPQDMPEMIQDLTSQSETWWCSTWRGRANDEIAHHLGVGPFPVVDDGNGGRGDEWKAEAARPLVESVLAAGRPVVWIQDFNGRLPDLAGVTYVDTGARGVLRWSDVPEELLQPAA